MFQATEKEPYYGDLEKTSLLDQLFHIPRESRDAAWQDKVLEHIADASFMCGDPQVMQGPDGFPYFQLFIPVANQAFQCYVLRHMVDDFLLQNGWGVVVNPKAGQPDWVFSFGDIVNFKLCNEFYTVSDIELPPSGILERDEQVLVGQPSETLLPLPVRKHMKQYMEWHGHKNVKIVLVSRKTPKGPVQQLIFNLTVEQFESQEVYQSFMQSLAWFLPRHYLYGSMDESVFKDQFAAI